MGDSIVALEKVKKKAFSVSSARRDIGTTTPDKYAHATEVTSKGSSILHGKATGSAGKENLPPTIPWSQMPEYRRQYAREYRAKKKAEKSGLAVQSQTSSGSGSIEATPVIRNRKLVLSSKGAVEDTQLSAVTSDSQVVGLQQRGPVDDSNLSLNNGEEPVLSLLDDDDESWLHRNYDWQPESSAFIKDNDETGCIMSQCVANEDLQKAKRNKKQKEYRKRKKEESAEREATERQAFDDAFVAKRRRDKYNQLSEHDKSVSLAKKRDYMHGLRDRNKNEGITGEEDLDAADPGIQYDLPVEEQDEEARLYGLRIQLRHSQRTHIRKPYPYEHLRRLSRQILQINELSELHGYLRV
ncbi:hypothetical protein EJB05_27100, partial [Eragrostis curvula]